MSIEPTSQLSRLSIGFIRLYQKTFSRIIGQQCRFHPTCSSYTISAIQQHGFWYGWLLGIKRIVKCNPMHPGGIDPVPPHNRHSSPPKRDN